jgi:Carboxypeptidase regulatory-like domain
MRERRWWPVIAAWSLVSLVAGVPGARGAATGTVAGNVRLAGPAPVRPPLPVVKSKEVCGETVPDDRLVVGPEGGVRYAVVSVEGVTGGRKAEPDVTLVLDNRECRFVPHVQVAEVGQWLEIHNSDPVLHSADARMGTETLFNVGLPPGRVLRKPLTRPGLISITCDVGHTWMNAIVAVAKDPYHTVTDAYGAYEIRDLPPGHYTLHVWHEELGTEDHPFDVAAGATATVDVAYPAPREEKKP